MAASDSKLPLEQSLNHNAARLEGVSNILELYLAAHNVEHAGALWEAKRIVDQVNNALGELSVEAR